MRKLRNKTQSPKRPFDAARIEAEKAILREYGLRRKHEIRVAESVLRRFRKRARDLIAVEDKEKEKILLQKLIKLGILSEKATLDDVLALTVKDVLNRRLQTIVFKRGLANTPKHARQLIVHGHVKINGRKIRYPSYIVPIQEEDKIEVEHVRKEKA